MPTDINQQHQQHQHAIQQLDQHTQQMLVLLQQKITALHLSQPLQDAVHYAVLQGGKRIRPKLVFAAALACGASISQHTYHAAMAVELIHCYSLIHDDLPCMDDDELRRGQPTCHIKFGEATALLAGDYLQALAFRLLTDALDDMTQNANLSATQRLAQVQVLSHAAAYMVDGQNLDLQAENKKISESELRYIHKNKTGALIVAAVKLGALSANIDLTDTRAVALSQFATLLGLAYQVQDDVLDVMADTQTLGKPAKSDEKLNKSTYPNLLGLQQAQTLAFDLHQQALLQLDGFSDASALSALTAQLLVRHF